MSNHFFRQFTQAKIGIKRFGHSQSTSSLLAFDYQYALARDAIFTEWNQSPLLDYCEQNKIESIKLNSAITSRQEYLKRPDLGRKLSSESEGLLTNFVSPIPPPQLIIGISNGLSSTAIEQHALSLLKILSPQLLLCKISTGPLILINNARVGISDAIGEILKPEIMILMIGERPGLSSHDGMSVYLTYQPRIGKTDAERNCLSNIRPPHGLYYEKACLKLIYLLQESLKRKISGVYLKDESDIPYLTNTNANSNVNSTGGMINEPNKSQRHTDDGQSS